MVHGILQINHQRTPELSDSLSTYPRGGLLGEQLDGRLLNYWPHYTKYLVQTSF